MIPTSSAGQSNVLQAKNSSFQRLCFFATKCTAESQIYFRQMKRSFCTLYLSITFVMSKRKILTEVSKLFFLKLIEAYLNFYLHYFVANSTNAAISSIITSIGKNYQSDQCLTPQIEDLVSRQQEHNSNLLALFFNIELFYDIKFVLFLTLAVMSYIIQQNENNRNNTINMEVMHEVVKRENIAKFLNSEHNNVGLIYVAWSAHILSEKMIPFLAACLLLVSHFIYVMFQYNNIIQNFDIIWQLFVSNLFTAAVFGLLPVLRLAFNRAYEMQKDNYRVSKELFKYFSSHSIFFLPETEITWLTKQLERVRNDDNNFHATIHHVEHFTEWFLWQYGKVIVPLINATIFLYLNSQGIFVSPKMFSIFCSIIDGFFETILSFINKFSMLYNKLANAEEVVNFYETSQDGKNPFVDVKKTYVKSKQFTADITISTRDGRKKTKINFSSNSNILLVQGEVGAGKSTFLQCINDSLCHYPDIVIKGELEIPHSNKNYFLSHELCNLFPAIDVISCGKAERRKLALLLAKKLNISFDRNGKSITFLEYSEGQKKGLMFIEAIEYLVEHKGDVILLLDEIFTNLDYNILQTMLGILQEMLREQYPNAKVIMVEHALSPDKLLQAGLACEVVKCNTAVMEPAKLSRVTSMESNLSVNCNEQYLSSSSPLNSTPHYPFNRELDGCCPNEL